MSRNIKQIPNFIAANSALAYSPDTNGAIFVSRFRQSSSLRSVNTRCYTAATNKQFEIRFSFLKAFARMWSHSEIRGSTKAEDFNARRVRAASTRGDFNASISDELWKPPWLAYSPSTRRSTMRNFVEKLTKSQFSNCKTALCYCHSIVMYIWTRQT